MDDIGFLVKCMLMLALQVYGIALIISVSSSFCRNVRLFLILIINCLFGHLHLYRLGVSNHVP